MGKEKETPWKDRRSRRDRPVSIYTNSSETPRFIIKALTLKK